MDLLEQGQLSVATFDIKTRHYDIPSRELPLIDNFNKPIPVAITNSSTIDPNIPIPIEPSLNSINEINPILSELPYCPSTLSGPRPLMYLTFLVCEQPIKSLVDSGASRSFINLGGLKLIENLNLKTVCKQGKVRVANSHIELVK